VGVSFLTVEELAAQIPDGASVAVPADYSGCAMAAVRALIGRSARDLELVTVPQAGLQADMLIGAGCVSVVETSAVTLGEHGQAPRFREAVSKGLVSIRDSTCPAIHAGLQASEKGVPFIPLRGILGSDLLAHRDDWRVIDNPFAENDPIVLLPAIQPDVALFHAAVADREGNVWIGVRRELLTMAHAARRTLVTVEEVVEDDLLGDGRTAAGTIPALYVTAVAEAPEGAWPIGLTGRYPADVDHLRRYARYLDEHVHARVG
jgi:glutaconate CoA-transferase subunit A